MTGHRQLRMALGVAAGAEGGDDAVAGSSELLLREGAREVFAPVGPELGFGAANVGLELLELVVAPLMVALPLRKP